MFLENNITTGVFCILLAALGYFSAWKKYRAEKYGAAVVLILLCGLLLRVYAGLDFYLHEWDERYHALVAKRLIDNPLLPRLYEQPLLPFDYKNWTANHIWVHKQPFALWLMALSLKLFGINELAVRLPSMLLSTAGIYLTYRLALYFCTGRRPALIAAFLHSIHGLVIELAAGRAPTEHIDSVFIFLVELGVFFAVFFFTKKKEHRPWYALLTGLAMGLAILTKWLPALIVLPVWLALALHERLRWREIAGYSVLMLAAAALVALPWQLYILEAFPREARWEYLYNRMHLFAALEDHGEPWYYHFDKLRMNFGELIYLPVLWFTWKGGRKVVRGDYRYLALLLWFWVPFLFFSLAVTKMQAYTLIAAPVLFMITALFWEYLYRYRRRFRRRWLVGLILFLLLALPVRYSIERLKPFQQRDRSPEWAEQRKALARRIDLSPDRVVIFGDEYPVVTMFYTGFTAYRGRPEEETADRLREEGYVLYLLEEDGALVRWR